MNPFVKTYIDQMHALVSDLTVTLEEYERRLEDAQDAKEDLLRQYWSAGRHISALEETVAQLPALEEENRELKEKNKRSLEHARRILDYAKTLSGAIQE